MKFDLNSYHLTQKLSFIVVISGFFLFSVFCSTQQSGWSNLPEILKQISPPEFPDRDFIITDYGAVNDSTFNSRQAIQQAIDSCSAAGGGRVIVPRGRFLTGSVTLKSNVNLYIEKDAVLCFSHDLEDFLPLVLTRFEGTELMNYSPFIYAYEQENVALTGEGTIDGRADKDHWWPWKGNRPGSWGEGNPNQFKDRSLLLEMGETGVPVESRIFGPGHYMRVNFVQFYRCKNVQISGITVKRSPMWCIHPVLSENVTVRDIRVNSHGPNNDGCNPESCKNVLIKNCHFDTGDDCIAIKSGRNNDGRRINVPSENIVVQDCTMRDGHGGVVMGSEISGSCRNVYIENCTMDSPNLERALRIKTNSRRGGVVENIYMRNVQVGQVSDAVIKVNFNYEEGDTGEFTPVVRNIFVENITSEKSPYALYLVGYERSPISFIHLKGCKFSGVEKGNYLHFVQDLNARDVYINGELFTPENPAP